MTEFTYFNASTIDKSFPQYCIMVTETTGVLGGYFQGKLCLNIPSDASVRPRPLRGGTAEGKACPGAPKQEQEKKRSARTMEGALWT